MKGPNRIAQYVGNHLIITINDNRDGLWMDYYIYDEIMEYGYPSDDSLHVFQKILEDQNRS